MSMTISSFVPSFTQQLLGNVLAGPLAQQSSPNAALLFAAPSTQNAQVGAASQNGRNVNPFSLDPASLYSINPMTAVALATSIGGMPPQAQSQAGRGQSLLGPDVLNNITPMNAVGLAIQLAGPLVSQRA